MSCRITRSLLTPFFPVKVCGIPCTLLPLCFFPEETGAATDGFALDIYCVPAAGPQYVAAAKSQRISVLCLCYEQGDSQNYIFEIHLVRMNTHLQ